MNLRKFSLVQTPTQILEIIASFSNLDQRYAEIHQNKELAQTCLLTKNIYDCVAIGLIHRLDTKIQKIGMYHSSSQHDLTPSIPFNQAENHFYNKIVQFLKNTNINDINIIIAPGINHLTEFSVMLERQNIKRSIEICFFAAKNGRMPSKNDKLSEININQIIVYPASSTFYLTIFGDHDTALPTDKELLKKLLSGRGDITRDFRKNV